MRLWVVVSALWCVATLSIELSVTRIAWPWSPPPIVDVKISDTETWHYPAEWGVGRITDDLTARLAARDRKHADEIAAERAKMSPARLAVCDKLAEAAKNLPPSEAGASSPLSGQPVPEDDMPAWAKAEAAALRNSHPAPATAAPQDSTIGEGLAAGAAATVHGLAPYRSGGAVGAAVGGPADALAGAGISAGRPVHEWDFTAKITQRPVDCEKIWEPFDPWVAGGFVRIHAIPNGWQSQLQNPPLSMGQTIVFLLPKAAGPPLLLLLLGGTSFWVLAGFKRD